MVIPFHSEHTAVVTPSVCLGLSWRHRGSAIPQLWMLEGGRCNRRRDKEGWLTISPTSSIVERGVPLVVSSVNTALVFAEQQSLHTLHRRGAYTHTVLSHTHTHTHLLVSIGAGQVQWSVAMVISSVDFLHLSE